MHRLEKRIGMMLLLLGVLIMGMLISPMQSMADDGGGKDNLGNIFDLTGVDVQSYKDGVAVISYKDSKAEVDFLAAAHDFDAKDFIGYAVVNGAQVILLEDSQSIKELLIWNGEAKWFELSRITLGTWASPVGIASAEVGLLEFYAPDSKADGGYQTLSLLFMHHDIRSPEYEIPAAKAEVAGYLDTDTMQYVSVQNRCVPISGNGWSYHCGSSTANNYGTYIYAGCDYHWTNLWFNKYHGAWVTVDNYGNLGQGGY